MAKVDVIIRSCIERELNKGNKKFMVFPFGDIGLRVKNILYEYYSISPEFIFDNNLCRYNPEIHPLLMLAQQGIELFFLV